MQPIKEVPLVKIATKKQQNIEPITPLASQNNILGNEIAKLMISDVENNWHQNIDIDPVQTYSDFLTQYGKLNSRLQSLIIKARGQVIVQCLTTQNQCGGTSIANKENEASPFFCLTEYKDCISEEIYLPLSEKESKRLIKEFKLESAH
jgi:hypothetical protein